MASTFLYVGGVVTSSKNVWKIEDNGSSLSVVASYLVGSAVDDVTAMVQDINGNVYVAVDSQLRVYKYDSTFTLDTAWGTSGYYSIGQRVFAMAVDVLGYLSITTPLPTGVDVTLLDDTGTLVWNDSAAPTYPYQTSFDGGGNPYFAGGGGSGWLMGWKSNRAAPYAQAVNYLGASGTNPMSGGKVLPDNYFVGVRNFTTNNLASVRIYQNDATVDFDSAGIGTLGNSSHVYNPATSIAHTDPLYFLGNNAGTKTIYKVQYDAVGGTLSVLASYDANNAIQSGNQMDFSNTGSPYLVSSPVVDEDGNTAKLRKLTSGLVLDYYTNDAVLGALLAVSASASGTANPQITSSSYKTYSKRLWAIGNNEFWYEDDSRDMVELAAANGDMDVTKPIDAFEFDEKVFVVNNTNFKIADFGNTKLQTDDIQDAVAGATSYPHRGTIVTGAGGAELVVDYVDATDGAGLIYGRKLNTTAFVNGELVSGTNDDGTTVKFDIKAGTTETAPPHWYDWTVYAGDSTFGTMPNEASIGVNWNGAPVISGNTQYPHQWYKFRNGDPWDLNYIALDARSPVIGNDADAGETGDQVVSLIPYKDDYLIHCTANSLWYFAGDPASRGRLLELSLTSGILSRDAWCWDKDDNLYIVSTTGILRMATQQGLGVIGKPQNITEEIYPDFIRDLSFDSTKHIIVVGYSKEDHGIKIAKTTIATGEHEGWWYDLRTGGLFPETHDVAAAPYCMFNYDATDPAYSGLLLGCADGHIRFEDRDDRSDDVGIEDAIIDSYVTFGPFKLGSENLEGIINQLIIVLTGGRTSGTLTDSSPVTFKVWTGMSSDEVVEKMESNTAPNLAGTASAPGRNKGASIRRPVRGNYAAIRIGNDVIDQTWGLEHIVVQGKPTGRVP